MLLIKGLAAGRHIIGWHEVHRRLRFPHDLSSKVSSGARPRRHVAIRATQTLHQFVVIGREDKGVAIVDYCGLGALRLVEEIRYQLLIFVNEERPLECFAVLREPLVLDALLSGGPQLAGYLEHLQKEVLALVANVGYSHLHCRGRVRIFVGVEHVLRVLSGKKIVRSQHVEKETPNAENV